MPRFCHHDTRGPPSIFLAQKTGTIADFPIRYRGDAYLPKKSFTRGTFVQTEFLQSQMQALGEQVKDLGETISKAAMHNKKTSKTGSLSS